MSKRRRNNKPQSQIKKPLIAPTNTLVDIVIPVYRRFDLLEKVLDSIPSAANGITYTTICVDNGSPVDESEPFYSSRDDIYVIKNSDNLGYPKACNQGVQRGNSPLIFILTSDVILEPNAIDAMVRELDDPKLGVVGMLLKFPEYAEGLNPQIRPSGKVQHVGLETNIHGNWVHQFIGWSVDNPKVQAQREVYAVTGAAFMTRRSLWNKVGGYDERYGLGTWEDVDYCMSIRELGYNIIVSTKAIATHYTGATAEAYKIGFPMNDNRMKFIQKWSEKLRWTEFLNW